LKDNKKDPLIRVIAKYSSSNIYSQILSILNAFIRPKLLTPDMYGLWQILIVIPKYSAYSTLGTHNILRYLIPYHDSRNEQEKIVDIQGSVFWGSFITKIFIAGGIVVIALVGEFDLKIRIGLLTMAYLVIMEWYYDYYTNILKSYQKFTLITRANYLQATVAFVGSALLIYFFGIYGVYLSAVITFIVLILYVRVRYPFCHYGKFNLAIFFDLVKRGFPIMIFNLSSVLISSTDKLVIAYFLGTEQLGYYGIAVIVLNFLMQIPGASREVLEPRLMQRLNHNLKEENLREYFLRPLVHAAYFMPLMIGPVFIIIPVVISFLLPRYVYGIEATQIISIGSYFLSMMYLARGIVIANNLQLRASLIMLIVVIVNLSLGTILVISGRGINGVAISCSISFFLLYVSLFIFIRKRYKDTIQEWRSTIMAICFPFPVMCLALYSLHHLSGVLSINVFIKALVNLLIYTSVILSVIYIARKKNILLQGKTMQEIWKTF
jgi:O-antigen/teichoic acid export membrane protein